MLKNAHIFNPLNDSLAEKVRAYRGVHDAWRHIEASMEFVKDEEWSNSLGEAQELEQAHEIILRSLNMATEAFEVEEIDQAVDQGLMSKDEATKFIQEKFDRRASLKNYKRLNTSRSIEL